MVVKFSFDHSCHDLKRNPMVMIQFALFNLIDIVGLKAIKLNYLMTLVL